MRERAPRADAADAAAPALDLPPEIVAAIDAAISAHRTRPGALLPILHDVTARIGYVPPAAIASIAHALNLSRAEVAGVVSYYHDFRDAPPGRCIVKVCRAEACQAVGADALVEHACTRLRVAMHATRDDGAVSLEPVYCLGNCALGPSITVDGKLYGRVTPERFDRLVAQVKP